MKIMIIRHGDRYYEYDVVTEKGQRGVIYLTKRKSNQGVTGI